VATGDTIALLAHEAQSMLARLELLQPYSEHMPMVPAAAVGATALRDIEAGLRERYRRVTRRIQQYLSWLQSPAGERSTPDVAQRRLARVRLLMSALMTEFDLFADVLTQRAEHRVGVLLSGLDYAALDMMTTRLFRAPPVATYLDRGAGAAIRRARSRLPGGGELPTAILRVPRERMISTGLAGSMAHEVGHQAAALLDLVRPAQEMLRALAKKRPSQALVWRHYERWASEIVADLWAVSMVGVAHTLGLFALLNLPTPHVFQGGLDRVHPIPWIRVHLGAELGGRLAPHGQWQRLRRNWSQLHPLRQALNAKQELLCGLLDALPEFCERLLAMRPPRLQGRSLGEVLSAQATSPKELSRTYARWQTNHKEMKRARPALVFAVLGQARADLAIDAHQETRWLEALIFNWAARKLAAGQQSTQLSVRRALAPRI
jgi:hypothetical protein